MKKDLEGPITRAEIKAAMAGLSRNKTPGPDGLPAEFFEAYSEILIPHLEELYKKSLELGHLPRTTAQALVVSLPKPGRDPTDMSGFRPLSLLCTEYKIESKVLANRIQPYLTKLIHIDQCGFVPARSTSLNLCRLHQITSAHLVHFPNAGCVFFPGHATGIRYIVLGLYVQCHCALWLTPSIYTMG